MVVDLIVVRICMGTFLSPEGFIIGINHDALQSGNYIKPCQSPTLAKGLQNLSSLMLGVKREKKELPRTAANTKHGCCHPFSQLLSVHKRTQCYVVA